ncbi:MAG: insulinase family protein [Phycisphaerales bacterium]|nr:MAG: insulinase family protein [Phycisphaerales bacterium]
MIKKQYLARFMLGLVAVSMMATPLRAGEIDIPYEKFVLDNGLTLLVHEDHKAPIVAVNIWYHVGSKNEKPGKTGFAHLFEHLMFNGSEHYDDDYFQAMERIGATDLNGTTSYDRTNYFQNVPTSALDIALWMESDRMGHLLGAVNQEKLDEQRGVVQNEKRQGDNRPYAKASELIQTACYPAGHPYSWTVIGSMQDLNDASLPDVHEWFKEYYGPNNAVLVVAGDITAQKALEKAKQYFGDIPPGPPIAKQEAWIAKRTGTHRQTAQDRVPQARIYRVWNVPPWGSADGDYLRLVADVLASGKNSRLYKRLVYDDQIATSVSASAYLSEIGGTFRIVATAKPGVESSRVETAIDEELERFLEDGPTPAELTRVKNQYRANFIRGIERIGGFGGKSDILATNMVYGGSPDCYKITLDRMAKATAQDLQETAVAWLSDGDYVLQITPFPELTATAADVDRSKLPEPGAPPQVQFPDIQRAELSNGLKLVLAERHSVPIVDLRLLVDAGYAADQFAAPGTASLAMDLLDEGTKTRSSLEINEQLQMLGSWLGTGAELDACAVYLNTLKDQLDPSLELFADVVLNPLFPQKEFDRIKQETLARIQREKVTPTAIVYRVFPGLLYGRDHAYGCPLTGTGTEASVSAITREELVTFHQTWFKPNNTTLIITGDITLAEIQPRLEKLFRSWTRGTVPVKDISKVADKPSPEVYIVDRPGSQQSVIFAGFLAVPRANPQEEAMQLMNNILGGDFTSRINMNLREDKHWSYGAGSWIFPAKAQRMYIAYSSVQSDKTSEAMQEVQKELRWIIGDKPPTEAEFTKTQSNVIRGLPGSWETIRRVAGSLEEIVQYDLPDNYFQEYPAKVTGMTLQDVRQAAEQALKPDSLVWIVVGEKAKIDGPIKAMGLPVTYVDADGNPL